MRINHNLPALTAFRNNNAAGETQAKSMEKLSSGLRINRAADDAAGLAISETMRGQLKGLNQATRNSQDAISMIQTAEGALSETHSILDRMRELANQSANATYTANDRAEMQKEIDQLKDEIDRIGNTTTFNNKNLLDGSASAITSSDKADTSVYVRGAVSKSGAYTLSVDATAGKGQIQKTNVFKIGKGDVAADLVYDNTLSGVRKADVTGLEYGAYQVATTAGAGTIAAASASIAVSGDNVFLQDSAATSIFGTNQISVLSSDTATQNGSLLFEITGIANNSVSYKVSYHLIGVDGKVHDGEKNFSVDLSTSVGTFTIDDGETAPTILASFGFTNTSGNANNLKVGDKAVYQLTASNTDTSNYDQIGIQYGADKAAAAGAAAFANYTFDSGKLDNTATDFKFFSLDASGKVYDGQISLTVGGLKDKADAVTFTAKNGKGELATLDTKLADIDKFTDANGKFLLDQPKTLTMIQGDGKKSIVQLYASDSLQDVVDKLNKAVAGDLGQQDIVGADNADKFVSYVTKGNTAGGVESASGTLVIRSAKAGADGQINIIGDEDVIKALGLSNVQDATESNYTVKVTDATNPNNVIADNVSIQGNKLVGVVDSNVDVEFNSQANIATKWNDSTKVFETAIDATRYTTTINVVNNSQTFQIGSNEGQTMTAAIGDMRASALGVDNILVTDSKSAAKAVTVIDAAITQVSAQRSSLGAVQNRLEHTINNLGVASENMTASESRIRDVDMASEMMEYTKMNILSQASQAMLAQANQKPQQALQLLQG